MTVVKVAITSPDPPAVCLCEPEGVTVGYELCSGTSAFSFSKAELITIGQQKMPISIPTPAHSESGTLTWYAYATQGNEKPGEGAECLVPGKYNIQIKATLEGPGGPHSKSSEMRSIDVVKIDIFPHEQTVCGNCEDDAGCKVAHFSLSGGTDAAPNGANWTIAPIEVSGGSLPTFSYHSHSAAVDILANESTGGGVYEITATSWDAASCSDTAQLTLLKTQITPESRIVCAGGGTVTFSLTADSYPQDGISWTMTPSGVAGGAAPNDPTPDDSQFIVSPGDVGQVYTITAELVRNGISCQATAELTVVKTDVEFQGLPEETAPPPNEEDPGAFICVDDTVLHPIELSIHPLPEDTATVALTDFLQFEK